MTKAPERIWAYAEHDDSGWFVEYIGDEPLSDTSTDDMQFSYTRTDHALALVAAAYEDAADTCFNPKWPLKTSTDSVQARTAGIIRARTPDDATAALERVKRDARNEALREAADAAKLLASHRFEQGQEVGEDPHTGECASQKFWLNECAKHIESLITEGQSDAP